MKLPVLDKFCFCLSLEVGGYIIGWFNIISGLFSVLLISILLTVIITVSEEKREEYLGTFYKNLHNMTTHGMDEKPSIGKLFNFKASACNFSNFLISAGIYFNLIVGIMFGIINVLAGILLILGIRSVRHQISHSSPF
ncbi:hypothetical protein ACKWTF_000969 [Chironomus riparius]